jgi:uncharacterized ion transporter superfamily protein YfcC
VHPAATPLFEFSRFRVFGWNLRPSPKHDDTEIQNTVYIYHIYIYLVILGIYRENWYDEETCKLFMFISYIFT